MPEVSLTTWNDFLRGHPEAHFLQTGEWGELKAAFGWRPHRLIVGRSGVQILVRELPLGLSVGYVARATPSQVRSDDSLRLWQEVDTLCRRSGAILCKVEPDAWHEPADGESLGGSPGGGANTGVWRSTRTIQPRRTMVVDLGPEEPAILARMKQKCRYNIRLAQKKSVVVRTWTDVEGFHRMLKGTGRRDRFAVHSKAYYERAYRLFHQAEMCELLVAEYNDEPLAALMVFATRRRAWYVYGGSLNIQRERMPNYLLQWEAMRWAKHRGCLEYDLWGIPDEDADALEGSFERRRDGLWGVYRFKRGFGGEVRRTVSAADRVYRRLLYRAYLWRVARTLS